MTESTSSDSHLDHTDPDNTDGDKTDLDHTDFRDTETEERSLRWSDVDVRILSQPIVVRSIIGVILATAIVLWPDRSDLILARLLGAGLMALGTNALWAELRHRPADRPSALFAILAGIVGGLLLVAPPERAGSLLGRGLGAMATIIALRIVIRSLRDTSIEMAGRAWPITQAALLAGIGALLLMFPTSMLNTAVAMAGLGWAVLGVIAVTMSLDPTTEGTASYTDAGRLVADWLIERPKSADDRQALYAKILYDGADADKRVIRFFTLMGFATVIASTGVIGNSTAVVIGAMLIAPLMTPLMGMAISLVMGWPNRLARSALVAGGGIMFAIAIGFVVALISPVAIDTTTNAQILARTSPTTLDLIIAVAAGAAGAYGLSRPDVSDSLPGVAIAISLVPPLTVVGISYAKADWSAGAGALLLFTTNMLAILLIGGLTFVVTGVTPVQRLTEQQNRTKTALGAVAAVATIVMGALMLNGAQITRDAANEGVANDAVARWLEPYPDHSSIDVRVGTEGVTAVVLGPSTGAPSADELADELARRLDREVTANVRLVVEERDSATASP